MPCALALALALPSLIKELKAAYLLLAAAVAVSLLTLRVATATATATASIKREVKNAPYTIICLSLSLLLLDLTSLAFPRIWHWFGKGTGIAGDVAETHDDLWCRWETEAKDSCLSEKISKDSTLMKSKQASVRTWQSMVLVNNRLFRESESSISSIEELNHNGINGYAIFVSRKGSAKR
ncbi:hypothetical protein V6N12_043184 [Hibiscus sabdariffa]|uniref:Uncharacterized protein n=1 Tax=Hibiscus sabdariffa TaxID=183260 RepID=A0ABR2DDJ6_9ROSI